jgi:hypothetical protein
LTIPVLFDPDTVLGAKSRHQSIGTVEHMPRARSHRIDELVEASARLGRPIAAAQKGP